MAESTEVKDSQFLQSGDNVTKPNEDIPAAGKTSSEPESFAKKVRKTVRLSVFDYVFTFCKKFAGYGFVYYLGYYEQSLAWVLIMVIIAVIREEWKREKSYRTSVARAAVINDERDVILARVGDLPSWVFFPDVERVEWLNKIMRQVWPNVNHYARNLIIQSIEPNIRECLKPYKMGSFKFDKIILGSIPPRIGGIKVYDKNVSREEIVMDLDIYYAGDCDFRISVKGIPAGIKDLQIHGTVRVVMKPLIDEIPLFGGLQIYFLNNPDLDFNLVGIADVFDMPGLSDLLHRIVVEQLAAMMVLPNKYPLQLVENIPARLLKIPEPEGVLRVNVIEARSLMKMDVGVLGLGKSDPYAVITVGAQEFRTKVINNTVRPKWDYCCEVAIDSLKAQILKLEVWDYDPGFPGVQNDDYLGRATVDIYSIVKKGDHNMWVTLEDVKTGEVHLELTWLKFSTTMQDLPMALAESQIRGTHAASLVVYMDSAKNLPSIKQSKPDPYCILTLGTAQQESNFQMRTADPVWEQGFVFLVRNPESDDLHIKVMDHKTSCELGHLKIVLSNVLEKRNMMLDNVPLQLKGSGPESKVFLTVQLKIHKRSEAVPINDQTDDTKSTHESSPPASPTNKAAISAKDEGDKKEKEPELKTSILSLEEMVTNTIIPPASVASVSNNSLRRRMTATSAGEFGLGRVQVTMQYNKQNQRLTFVLHKLSNLPIGDESDLPDPYVKLYILPERAKESKRKTDVHRDECSPVYEETFDFNNMTPDDLLSQKVEITVVSKKSFFAKSPVMGVAVLELCELKLGTPVTEWFDLHPADPAP